MPCLKKLGKQVFPVDPANVSGAKNAATWTKVDKERSSLNEYLTISIPGPLASKKVIQLSDAATKTATASLVDRRLRANRPIIWGLFSGKFMPAKLAKSILSNVLTKTDKSLQAEWLRQKGIDGISTAEMSHTQLEEHIIRLREELDREREERNFFHLEKDKINTFWEITKSQLEDVRSELRTKEREMEEAEERHHLELKVYKQKVKHLLYEHQNRETELKSESATVAKILQAENAEVEEFLRKDQRNLKCQMSENICHNAEHVKELKKDYEKQIRQDFETKLNEQQKCHQERIKIMVDDLNLQRKNELHDIEERKNNHINRIMQDHDKAFSDMKNYYNDITVNNMALISSLKEQLAEQKKNQERLERQISELQAENRRLVEPLKKACEENEDLKRRMTNYEKDKALFKMEKERDELYERFVAAIQEVQQKTGLKNLLLEKRLQALTDVVEKKEVQLNEVLAASNLDPAAVTAVSHKLNAHNDLLATCEGKLRQFGIPPEELGFQPLKTSAPKQTLGQGPAGLVSVPP
ncbi:hypothetical protein T265_10621 [Opisthorchis viverrini]|uniref:Dynein regulatory complex subunit 4 n=1 Tax=Opisthorchis viverrini TaxID=6198 RepID=A0A074Z1S5_OPIVI|nr:hypothetical protein T265_10621 [Opisthorchis viverrini]KER20933.1 hypothetical protein T265_10621 [Opisthorchis viverrini]